ncbi:single-stranded DNA-binding protein [Microbacterium dextranolyticum]|uniref:Single-stranded DNA-binding protein 1 n=1 Tax=Microbacterium dextranolyticum TaxID=36806 RepID=A0A9W6HMS9_9MICO|nr:single-stranded DNA-binding protein [Microbacterium dextranolyticum]MBM7462828.1 single-strand DNA-binding protein [Microbacterium dextranolyticum]GLJ96067.1 single-stranded DNA-binding protein 1 [Microbacterium dextranolyticum]
MSDLIAVTGNITSSPTRHDIAGNVSMVTFGVASTERRWENGSWSDGHTNFYNVSVFRSLAEHAFASLGKGQRVIVAGKLRVRRWEANGRSGTSVDLEATSLGPDLMFGVASFVKDARATADDGRPRGTEDWAPDGSVEGPVDGSTGEILSSGSEADAVAPETHGELVTVSGWGAPSEQTSTPF